MIKVSVEGKENLGLKYYSSIIYSQLLLQDSGIFFYNKKELLVSFFYCIFVSVMWTIFLMDEGGISQQITFTAQD